MSFALKLPAFSNGSQIPSRYTCIGEDLSPALAWSGVPPAARTLALIAEDPDAPRGTFTHWLIWNLPARHSELPQGVPGRETFDDGARQGANDFGRIGYEGPCPPHGRPHRYFFRLYALDTALNLESGASRQDLDRAMKGHVLAQADWMGVFGR
ncbi:MAG: YbhB/YbcL family Raf kinase inhibitor-like protein [Terracidiphilus sp.]